MKCEELKKRIEEALATSPTRSTSVNDNYTAFQDGYDVALKRVISIIDEDEEELRIEREDKELEIAISHAQHVGNTSEHNACAREHNQLAKWLRELRQRRKKETNQNKELFQAAVEKEILSKFRGLTFSIEENTCCIHKEEECPACQGTGNGSIDRKETNWSPCPSCEGVGVTFETKDTNHLCFGCSHMLRPYNDSNGQTSFACDKGHAQDCSEQLEQCKDFLQVLNEETRRITLKKEV